MEVIEDSKMADAFFFNGYKMALTARTRGGKE
jgi:hypothetical protein